MIRLTAPNGDPVMVEPSAISSMYTNDGTYHPDARTVLVVGGNPQAVKESLDMIEAMIAERSR